MEPQITRLTTDNHSLSTAPWSAVFMQIPDGTRTHYLYVLR